MSYSENSAVYRIIGSNKRMDYQKLSSIAFDVSQHFSISTFKSIHKKNLSEGYFEFLNSVEKFEVDDYGFNLPQHYEKRQKIHIYQLNTQTKKLIEEVNRSSEWRVPKHPEDLSFYINKRVWLYSITHEDLYLIKTSNEALLKRCIETNISIARFL